MHDCAYWEGILFVTFIWVSDNNTRTWINFLLQSFFLFIETCCYQHQHSQMLCSACSRWEVDSTTAFLTLKHLINCSMHSRAAASGAWDIDLADSGTPQLFCHIMWVSSNSNATYLLWWQLLHYGFPESSSMAAIYVI